MGARLKPFALRTVSVARARGEEGGDDLGVAAAPGHSERRAPLAVRTLAGIFGPRAGVDVGAARDEELDDFQPAALARLDERVLVFGNHAVDVGAAIQEERHDGG